jgi:hypothetical protein
MQLFLAKSLCETKVRFVSGVSINAFRVLLYFEAPKVNDLKACTTCLLLCFSVAAWASHPVHVRPTVTKQGQYRQQHYWTAPNYTQRDNWTAKGNTNNHESSVPKK